MDWQNEHLAVIKDFLMFINEKSDNYILKGGTALLTCYGLDRFSEDIDFDSTSPEIIRLIEQYANERGYNARIAKDTDITKRCMLAYGTEAHPLKIETSYRRLVLPPDELTSIGGTRVYNINALAAQKAAAFAGRDRLRDLYDLAFMCDNYWDDISDSTKTFTGNVIAQKGLEQFDWLISTQKDALIDADKLAESYLRLFDKFGLLNTVSVGRDVSATEAARIAIPKSRSSR